MVRVVCSEPQSVNTVDCPLMFSLRSDGCGESPIRTNEFVWPMSHVSQLKIISSGESPRLR